MAGLFLLDGHMTPEEQKEFDKLLHEEKSDSKELTIVPDVETHIEAEAAALASSEEETPEVTPDPAAHLQEIERNLAKTILDPEREYKVLQRFYAKLNDETIIVQIGDSIPGHVIIQEHLDAKLVELAE